MWKHKVSGQMSFASGSISKVYMDTGNLKNLLLFFFFFLRKVRELKVYCIYLDESFESILPAHAVITQIENRLDILFITPPQPDFYKSVVHVMQIYFES